jgi:hypothetical protein
MIQTATAYASEAFAFGKDPVRGRMTYREAAESVRDGEAAAVLLDMLEPEGLDRWWHESLFPEIVQHKNFSTAATSGIAIGPIQRLEKDKLILGLIDYFAYAGKTNERLRETEFVKLIVRELGAAPVRIGAWAEFPLASRREFVANERDLYSVGPHCDSITFGRDTANWPIKAGSGNGYDQLSTVLTIDEAENGAGIVLWDVRPQSRAELDKLMDEFTRDQSIERLKNARSVTVRGRAGQMTVLNTRLLHAVERCASPRRTIGAFLLWDDDDGWRMFH